MLFRSLGTISRDEIVGYLLHVIDMEYQLTDENPNSKGAEKFLADKRFDPFRDAIFAHVNDEDEK